MKRFFALFLCVALCGLVACEDKDTEPVVPDNPVPENPIPDPDPEPEPETDPNLMFELDFSEFDEESTATNGRGLKNASTNADKIEEYLKNNKRVD